MTMRAVADRAGVTAPALYWHFADKEALLREVMRQVARLFRDRMAEALALPSAEARLRRSLEVFRAFAVEHPSYFHVLFVRPPLASRGREVRDSAAGPTIFQLLTDRVADCMREGSLAQANAESIAVTFAALAQGLMVLHERGRFASDQAFAAFFEQSVERLLNGLR